MATLTVPIVGPDGADTDLVGRVPLPAGWNEPSVVGPVTVLVPGDLAAHVATGFAPNVTVSSGVVADGEPVVEPGTEDDDVLARTDLADDGHGAARLLSLALASAGDVEVLQLTCRWRHRSTWFEVVCSSALLDWDAWANAFDEIVEGSRLGEPVGTDSDIDEQDEAGGRR